MGYALTRDPDIPSQSLAKFFATGSKAGIQAAHAEPLSLILAALNAATIPGDMGLPGLKLHRLKGGRSGAWSVTVRANWRITFRFEGKDAVDVDYEDYH
jgi:toxin HigB-1